MVMNFYYGCDGRGTIERVRCQQTQDWICLEPFTRVVMASIGLGAYHALGWFKCRGFLTAGIGLL